MEVGLVPARPRRWHSWSDVADLFVGSSNPDWISDRELFDQDVRAPWAGR